MAVVISEGLFYFCYLSCTVVILSGISISAQNSTSTQIPSAETTTMLNSSVSFSSLSGLSPSANSDMAMSTKDLGSDMNATLSPTMSTTQMSDLSVSSDSIFSNSDTHLSSHSLLSSEMVPTSVSVTMDSSSSSLIMQVNETSTLKIDVNTESTSMPETDSVENLMTTALQTSMPQTDSIENTITTALQTSMLQTNIIENTMTTALQTSMLQTNIIENTMTTDFRTSTLQTDSMDDSKITILQTSSLDILNTDSISSIRSSGISIIASVDSLVSADMSSNTEIFSNTLSVKLTESSAPSTIHLEPSSSVISNFVSSIYLSHDMTSLPATETAMMSDAPTIVQTNSLVTTSSSMTQMTSNINAVQSTTMLPPIMSSDIMTSSSSLPVSSTTTTTSTTSTTTTTTKPTTTTLKSEVEVDMGDNNVFEIPTKFTINCTNKLSDVDLRKHMKDQLFKNITEIRDIIVILNPCKNARRRRKRAAEAEAQVKILVGALVDPVKLANEIVYAFYEDKGFNLTDSQNFNTTIISTLEDLCQSDVCSIYVGYDCVEIGNKTVKCFSRCSNDACSDHGTCNVFITSTNEFATQCICDSEEYYNYEGSSCEIKRMKWELAVAIAAGSLGAVIVILIFILIIYCCCKSKEDKYEYRGHSYEPMSEVRGRPGPAYYRNEGVKSMPGGFANFGYEDDQYSDMSNPSQRQMKESSWNPEDSKDTYAKISEKLDKENSFHIKRPQVSSIRQSGTGEATTGF